MSATNASFARKEGQQFKLNLNKPTIQPSANKLPLKTVTLPGEKVGFIVDHRFFFDAANRQNRAVYSMENQPTGNHTHLLYQQKQTGDAV